jgi:hypothetical protein
VTLVTDFPADAPAVRAVIATLGRPIQTVRPEPAFEITTVTGATFDRARRDRNLVLLGDLSAPGPTADRIRALAARLDGARSAADSGGTIERLVPDPWAHGQTVLVLGARGEDRLAQAIGAESERIYREFEAEVTRQTGVLLFSGGREQPHLRQELARKCGFSLRIPKGYRAGGEMSAGFVRFFMREGGSRLIFVHWEDGVRTLPPPDSCLALRARIAARYYTGDFVDFARSHVEPATFLGREAYRLAGLWQNDQYTMGGPFRSYCFVDRDRLILIDLAVFDPAGPKAALLRQLEAISLTYRDERGRQSERQGGS